MKRIEILLLSVVCVLGMTGISRAASSRHFTGVHGSSEYIFIYGTSITIGGQPADVGDEVAVVSEGGVLCGATVLTQAGEFPAVSVYRDDPMTTGTDGAVANEALHFRVWDASEAVEYGDEQIDIVFAERTNAAGLPYWTSNFDAYRVDLAVGGDGGRDGIVLEVNPGWNLLSVPFTPDSGDSIEDVLSDPKGGALFVGTVWAWDADSQHYVSVTGRPSGQQGMWVYRECTSTASATRMLKGSLQRSGEMSLTGGWNLVGPSSDLEFADVADDCGAIKAWQWNTAQQSYEIVLTKGIFRRGNGYWIWSEK